MKKKLKKYWKVGIELSINDNAKSHQMSDINLASVSKHVRKKLWNLMTRLI